MKTNIFIIINLLIFSTSIVSAQQEDDIYVNPTIQISNEKTINSAELEFSPSFYEDGIIFVSTRDAGKGTHKMDKNIKMNTMSLFQSKRGKDGKLTEPVPLSTKLITKYHEGPVTFNSTQDVIYYTLNNGAERKLGFDKNGRARLKIYEAHKQGGDWGDITALPFNGSEFETAHPSISVDGERMYFSSDRAGGFGGMDLYVSYKNGSQWSEPRNLGSTVNSQKNEVFPFIHADETLFFASDGHPGKGGLDLFFTKGGEKDNNWEKPHNLGAPLNTEFDDLGLIVDRDKKNGYFSSSRPTGSGGDDIYSFFLEEGKLGEPYERKAQNVTVFVSDKATSDEIANAKIECYLMDELNDANFITDSEGNVLNMKLSKDGKNELVLDGKKPDIASGFTDKEGKKVLLLKFGKNLCNVSKEGYNPKQVIKEIAPEINEYLVLLDKSSGKTIAFRKQILNSFDNSPIPGAKITLTDDETGETIELTTDANGFIDVNLPVGKNYTVTVSKDGLGNRTGKISTKDPNKPIGLDGDFNLSGVPPAMTAALREGAIIRLPHIYYNFNDDAIRPDAQRDLDAVVGLLTQYPEMVVELLSHTDSRGTNEYNIDLSQRRANNAKIYIIEKGIDPNRLIPKGYGETQLKNNCTDKVFCSEYDHQINRRTEIRAVKLTKGVDVTYENNPPAVVHTKQEYLKEHGKGNTEKEYSASTKVPTEYKALNSSTPMTKEHQENTETYSAGTSFWVIAGVFSKNENALNQLAKIQAMGYNEAEIVDYKNGSRAVVVKKFDDINSAQNLGNELRTQHNIESFVKTNNPN